MTIGDLLKDVASVAVEGLAKSAVFFVPGGGAVMTAYEAKKALDAVGTISQRHLYVANNIGVPVSVIAAPNKDWVASDLVGSLVLLVASMGSSAPSGLSGLKAAKTLYDVYQATRYIRGAVSVVSTVWDFFSKKGCKIDPEQLQCVNQRSNSNPLNYLSASQIGAVFGASDISIYIITQDGRTAFFNTNSDAAWVVDQEGIKRAQTGKTWQVDASQPVIAWNS